MELSTKLLNLLVAADRLREHCCPPFPFGRDFDAAVDAMRPRNADGEVMRVRQLDGTVWLVEIRSGATGIWITWSGYPSRESAEQEMISLADLVEPVTVDALTRDAAPDLLAALQGIEAQRQSKPERLLSALHLWDAARAAIAKATGEEPGAENDPERPDPEIVA
jgi:hypothetical protein